MDDTDYILLKNSLKEIICKIFTNYKKAHTSTKICGMALYSNIFETNISMGIITNEHIKNNNEFIFDNIWEKEEWCDVIENDELIDYKKTLREKLPFFYPPIQREADWQPFIDSNIELLTLPYEVLDELNKEQYFKEFGNNFMLLFVNHDGPGSFVIDIKRDIDGLFNYKLNGWYREIFDTFYEVNEEEDDDDDE